VVKPDGDDAAVVKMIEAARLKDFPPPPPAAPKDDRRDRPAGESVRQWVERREQKCDDWLSDRALCEELAKQTKSTRFRASASCWLGFRAYSSRSEDHLKEAARLLTACRDSDGASQYVKGFADYHLLLCKLEDQTDAARKEAKKLAEALIEDYPNTFMADKAREALNKLTAAEK
jgi:hypothetical protein